MSHAALYEVRGGLATFGQEMLHLRELLEARFLSWAAEVGAEPKLYPPLLRVADLDLFDYFQNFPHLALVTSAINPDLLVDEYGEGAEPRQEIPCNHLSGGKYALPSAACFNVFLDLSSQELTEARYVTTVATCFRNENTFNDLRRLWAFTMREIVCVGPVDAVKAHLRSFKERISGFTAAIGLPLEIEFATDPFFTKDGSRARMQKLFPQKEELLYGSLAIGSLNFHRNFFGERCDIATEDGSSAFTGCVAFGIERWLYALLDVHGGDADKVASVLTAA